ncbi:MAG: glycosyltransferase family 9 protein, partial [Fusobacteriaceae bacterium]
MKILVIRLSSIGDIILTTPVLRAFKEKYPDAVVDFLVMDKFKDSIEGSAYVDNLILFKKGENDGIENLRKFAKKLKKNKYDYVFDLHGKFRSLALTKFIGIKSYRYKKRSLWKTILVKMRAIRYSVDDTIVKNYFGAFRKFGIKYSGEKISFPFTEKDLDSIDKNYYGLPIMAPGASKNTKKWIPEEFGKLAKIFHEKWGVKTLIIGGPEDNERAKIIEEISGGAAINITGKLSLKESGALLSKG